MENQKQVSKFLLYIGAGLSILSLIGLVSTQSARRAGAFGEIVSVSDCQISFLQGGAGCNESASPLDTQETLWQAGLLFGIIALGVAAWMNWAANNRQASVSSNGSSAKKSSTANSSGAIKKKLVALEDLRKEKLISEAEFKTRRQKLLKDL
jgi:hypothetical protein